jgi:hypothetical protein
MLFTANKVANMLICVDLLTAITAGPMHLIAAAGFPVLQFSTSSHLLCRRYMISTSAFITIATVRMMTRAVNVVTYVMQLVILRTE